MKCQKALVCFIIFFCALCSSQLHATSPSFAPIYANLDKLEMQVKDLKMNLLTQQALSQQLQEQLSKSTQDLATCQSSLTTASQQLQQSQTALEQASATAEILSKQYATCEHKLKVWKITAIVSTVTAVITTLILMRK